MDSIYENRISRLRKTLAEKDLNVFIVLTEENRLYLSGFAGEDTQFDESAGALIITDKRLILATDPRFTIQAQREASGFEIYIYEKGLPKELPVILKNIDAKKAGFESKRMSFYQYGEMVKEADNNGLVIEFVPTESIVEDIRVIKDESEINETKKAVKIAESAFQKVIEIIKPGMTEKEIAWLMEIKMREAGADSLSFPIICASGPNSALPHATPENRIIREGEPLLFDWGARLNGYCSDISRTIFFGKPDDVFIKIFKTVVEAQNKAIEAIKPGVSGKYVDEVARNHIEQNGYVGKFSHGLGHGTGLAVHEGPRLSKLSTFRLEPGMIVTVEPGIYIENIGGVRIENQVVVRDYGAEVLNQLKTSFN